MICLAADSELDRPTVIGYGVMNSRTTGN